MDKICAALVNTTLFKNVNQANLAKVCDKVNERSLWKGEILVNEGDRSDGIYVVSAGVLAMQKYSIDGDYVSLNLLEESDMIGYEFFYAAGRHYTYSVEAVTNAEVIYIPRDIIINLSKEDEQLSKNFLRLLSDSLNEQYIKIDILSQRNLRLKISKYLIYLHTKSEDFTDDLYGDIQKRSTSATPFVELPVSKEVTAKLLAMPRPSFSRELVSMEKEGLIRVNGRIIWLLDLRALVMMGDDSDDEDDF